MERGNETATAAGFEISCAAQHFAIWQVVDVEAPKLCSRNSERCTRADVLAGVGKIRLAY